jgi:iron complex transport system substrate-binding protein
LSESDATKITGEIVHAAYAIHLTLGPGLLESVYERLLKEHLEGRGLKVERQKYASFEYNGIRFTEGLRLDLLVQDQIVVEVKSVECLLPLHAKQLMTYLRVLQLRVGLLVNFGGPTIKDGLRRIVNDFIPRSPTSPLPPLLRVNSIEMPTANDG